MAKISNLTTQPNMATSDRFVIYSLQNGDALVNGTNMITSLDIVTNASLSASLNSRVSVVKTANYTVTVNDEIILCDNILGDFFINLPQASTVKDRVFTIKKIDTSSNTATIDPFGPETIDGIATFELIGPNKVFATVYCDGTGWHVIG